MTVDVTVDVPVDVPLVSLDKANEAVTLAVTFNMSILLCNFSCSSSSPTTCNASTIVLANTFTFSFSSPSFIESTNCIRNEI